MTSVLPTKIMATHGPLDAFQHLVEAAKVQLQMAGRGFFHPYARRLAIAAVAFTVQVAIEYGYDVETVRAMERDLIARLESEP